MRVLYFDLIGGISGDMTVAALAGLCGTIEPLERMLILLGMQDVQLRLEPVTVHGIRAQRFQVLELPDKPGNTSRHGHRHLADVLELLNRADMPQGAHARAECAFRRLAEAEARVHGCSVEQVAFHEVGALDSIVDIFGAALLLEALQVERVMASPVPLGHGFTHSQHGVIPLPAPATLELLQGRPTLAAPIEGETVTPTGAAFLAAWVDEFCAWPTLTLTEVAYGAGTCAWPDRPNLLRAVLGQQTTPLAAEFQLEANIDDMSAELFEHVMERLFENGALDVWFTPVVMKKSRPAVVLGLLAPAGRCAALEHILFTETTSLGVRHWPIERRKLERRWVEVSTPFGAVRVKLAGEGNVQFTAAPEYEDCRRLAREKGVALKEVFAAAQQAYARQRGNCPPARAALTDSDSNNPGRQHGQG